MKRLMLFFAIATLSGCSTKPVASVASQPVPADRIFAYQPAGNDPMTGTLIVARDAGAMMGACPFAFSVDGKVTAHIRRGESATLAIPAGNRIISAEPTGKGVCSWGNEDKQRRETSVTIETGVQTKVRVGVTNDGIIQITPTAF